MELKDIAFTGLGRAMSDLDCKDGEMSVSHNIVLDNGAMRPIWVPEDMMQLQDAEKLVYIHRTAAYKNYIVTGRARVTNNISVYHKYGKEYPDNYLKLTVVLQYPAASELKIYLKCLIAGFETERTIIFPKGTLGKQVLSMGEQDSFIEARYEAQDSHYNYVLTEYDDSNNESNDAEWNENPPEFLYALNFFTDKDSTRKKVIELPTEDYAVKLTSIGNTLIVTSERGLEYVLYKDDSYKALGQKPPELDMSFKMKLARLSSAYDYAKITADGNTGKTTFDEKYRSEVSLQIAAKTNEVLAKAENENWFTSTFYVRWAYRMYGGVYMASPPVMMPLNGGISPLLSVLSSNGNGIYTPSNEGYLDDFWLEVFGYKGKLQYEIPFFDDVMKELRDWEDVVDGIELYVTRGTTMYNQDGEVKGIVHGDDTEQCVSYGFMQSVGNDVYARRSGQYLSVGYYIDGMYKTEEEYRDELLSNGVFYKLKSYGLDELKKGTIEVELDENSLKNLTTAPVLSKETSEYLEHDMLYPDGVFVYNKRLNLHGVKSEKYNFPVSALAVYTDGSETEAVAADYSISLLTENPDNDGKVEGDTDIEVDENGNPTGGSGGGTGGVPGDTDGDDDDVATDGSESGGGELDPDGDSGNNETGGVGGGGNNNTDKDDTEVEVPEDPEDPDVGGGENGDEGGSDEETDSKPGYRYSVRFVINNEGQSVNVTNTQDKVKLYEAPLYLFYPDNNARKAIIERYDTNDEVYEQSEVSLTSHPTLQGCYWFGGFERLAFKEVDAAEKLVEEAPEDRRVDNSGKIYTSEVNNPFVFPLGGINTIGTGDVIGISTVTKALSQGQFGQFPLYVFSTEGVWAMEVGSNGLYSSVKPVSRDVCINGDSITQTDNAVLFVSERGVMMLDGSSVMCISDMMNGRSFDAESVYGLSGLLPKGMDEVSDFVDYARTARMAYDYANARILLYREDKGYCYVFSMTSSTWATVGMEIENAVSDYPDVYVQKESGVKNLSTRVDYDSEEKIDTLIVTRPVKLGSDGFKTIYEMIARGSMNRKEGALLLWGSHDGMEYVLIKSVYGSRMYRTGGSGYRYFRVGVVGRMNVGETLSMMSVGFMPKYQNKLR